MLIEILIALAVGLAAGLAANTITYYLFRHLERKARAPAGPGAPPATVPPAPAVPLGLWITLMLVPLGVVLVFYLSYYYWAVSRYERIGLIIAAFIITLLCVLLQYLAWRSKRFINIVPALIWIMFVVMLGLAHLGMPKYLRFDCPAQVPSWQVIKGEAAGALTDDHFYPIVYNAQGTIGYIQPVIGPEADHHWSTQANFGGPPGTKLTLIVYASPTDLKWIQGTTISHTEVVNHRLIESRACEVEVTK